MDTRTFITGSTGLVGGNILYRILQRDATSRVALLVRAASDDEARRRIQAHLHTLCPDLCYNDVDNRIEIIRGDVSLPLFGLSRETYDALASRITHIIHSAATVQFNLDIQTTRAINVGGTMELLNFASRVQHLGHLIRVAHISTAYVSGNRTGTILEDPSVRSDHFANNYEQAKYEAEQYVRRMMATLPLMIFRPSIIVGDSRTGITTAFNVLYTPLKFIHKGIVRFIPGSPSIPLDVVPVDYVADAIHHIFFSVHDAAGKIFHLTAGKEKVCTTGDVISLAARYFTAANGALQLQTVRFLPMIVYTAVKRILRSKMRKLIKAMEPFVPYLTVQRVFDNSNTVLALQGSGIAVPHFEEYYENILQYCLQAQWGKRS